MKIIFIFCFLFSVNQNTGINGICKNITFFVNNKKIQLLIDEVWITNCTNKMFSQFGTRTKNAFNIIQTNGKQITEAIENFKIFVVIFFKRNTFSFIADISLKFCFILLLELHLYFPSKIGSILKVKVKHHLCAWLALAFF